MRVLFVPFEGGPISHGIPLLALDKMLKGPSIETAFLAPRHAHEPLQKAGANVLDIDHNGFRTEMMAYGEFSPSVVVDDASITTGYAVALSRLPRVAIHRTGIFPGGRPRFENHQHSLGLDLKKLPSVTFLSLAQPQSLSDLFKADIKIVPGIRSIELLPEPLQNDPTYFFSGPLLLEDSLVDGPEPAGSQSHGFRKSRQFDSLREFFDKNVNRRVVYVTVGTVARPTKALLDCIQYLLGEGIAIVSSIKVDHLNSADRDLYYYAAYLPLHFVCSNVDLAIHHCGSGTYHYPILHGVPAITIGTNCYDRDDVALRLEELGVSVHIPASDDEGSLFERFRSAVRRYFDESSGFMEEKRKNLVPLNEEIRLTSSSFDFEALLGKALSSQRSAT